MNTAVEDVTVYFPSADGNTCFLISSHSSMRYERSMETVLLGSDQVEFDSLYSYLTEHSFYDQFVLFSPQENGIALVNDEDNSASEPCVFFLSTLNTYNSDTPSPVLLIRISNDFLSKMMSNVIADGQGAAFITNGKNHLVAWFPGDSTLLAEGDLSFTFWNPSAWRLPVDFYGKVT